MMGLTAYALDPSSDLVDQVLPSGSFSDGTLDLRLLSQANYSFSDPTSAQNLTFDIINPSDTSMPLYLAQYTDGEWSVIDSLGSIGPGKTLHIKYPVDFSYTGKPSETDTFGVIGETPSGYVGKIFVIGEDWTTYESYLRSWLSIGGVIVATAMLFTLLIVMGGVIAVAARTKHEELAGEGEYTFWTLFFPLMRTRPMAEKIADIIITPWFWAVEALFGAVLVLIVLLITITMIPSDIGVMVFLIGGVCAIFMPLIFLVIGWLADYYERDPFRFLFAMFMWGVMVTFAAFLLNTTLDLFISLILGSTLASLATAVLVAPVVEESSKGFGLLIMAGHHEMDDMFDGILYGFAIGMGFAAIENWLYFAANANPVSVEGLTPWAFNILYRSVLCSLAHGGFTAATGGVIGFMKSKKSLRKFAFLGYFLGLPIAIILHASFNFTAILDEIMQMFLSFPVPVFDPMLTLGMTGIYIILGVILQLKLGKRLKSQQQPFEPGG
ncbi:MAG TPA: PrsW family intramembrane metalloprotease [Methanocella sp.]|nr:PrsW family intramembrane metalloprotease [Methanocella sp.]